MLYNTIKHTTSKTDYTSLETTRMMANLSASCQTMYNLFHAKLSERKLLTLVLQGNELEVLKIAKTNPRLFFIKATARDYAMDLEGNCRTIKNWSPYQALFGTGDVDLLAKVKLHLNIYLSKLTMNDPLLIGLPLGMTLISHQQQEKFPNGVDYPLSTYNLTT